MTMSMTVPLVGAPKWSGAMGSTLRRWASTFAPAATRFVRSRAALTLLVCTVVSTQTLFQPNLFSAFDLEVVASRWLDYFGECVIMGFAVMLGGTLAQMASRRAPRSVAAVAVVVGLTAGAVAGGLLLIPYYELPVDSAFDYRFIGDCLYWLVIGSGIALIHALQQRAARASAALHRAQVDQMALSGQMAEAQLQLMRAQIEPHFLFNTLANVKRLADTDVHGGVSMLNNLVRYLRAALPHMRESATTTLGQEADLVQAYLALLKIRMGTRLRFSIDVPTSLRDVPFPPMMILTLAENAIKHGLNPSEHGGAIGIRVVRDGDQLCIRVADTGVGFGGAPTSGTGVGLANTRARLAAVYGDRASLDLEANEPAGVRVMIRVPFARPATPEARIPDLAAHRA